MNFNRTDGDDALTLPSPTTRQLYLVRDTPYTNFSTGLLGFDGIILEATQAAQVVSVTLF